MLGRERVSHLPEFDLILIYFLNSKFNLLSWTRFKNTLIRSPLLQFVSRLLQTVPYKSVSDDGCLENVSIKQKNNTPGSVVSVL